MWNCLILILVCVSVHPTGTALLHLDPPKYHPSTWSNSLRYGELPWIRYHSHPHHRSFIRSLHHSHIVNISIVAPIGITTRESTTIKYLWSMRPPCKKLPRTVNHCLLATFARSANAPAKSEATTVNFSLFNNHSLHSYW